jgi:phosphatidylglycerophosphate synthase
MIDSNLRKYFQNIFDGAGKILAKSNISPNLITVTAFIVGLFCMFSIINKHLYIALALLWISGLLDVLDGTVARLLNKSTYAGMYLDLILDRMVEAAVIFGFAIAFPQFYLVYIGFLIFALFNFTTFIVAGAILPNKSSKGMHYDSGMIERTEAFIAFSLMMVFPAYIFYILFVFNTLMLITGLIRFFKVIGYISQNIDNQQ